MSIAWSNFTPYSALLGGVLIGIAAAALMLFNGRIAGISGIVGGLFGRSASFSAGEKSWRIAFVLGLVLAPFAYRLFAALPESQVDASWPVLIVAGLLVGFGTRYGSGCTSGHGVCGLSRFSARSLVATLLFMAAGFVTVYLLRHLLGA